MNAKTLARYEARSQVFKALAHPSRLLIVDELTKSERCVCELTALKCAASKELSACTSKLYRFCAPPITVTVHHFATRI